MEFSRVVRSLETPGKKKALESSLLAVLLGHRSDVMMSEYVQVVQDCFLAVLAPHGQLKRQSTHAVMEPTLPAFRNFAQTSFGRYMEVFELQPKHSVLASYPKLVLHPLASGLVEMWYTWFWLPISPPSEQQEARLDPLWVEEL